jgi:fatty-acyl-CoA synthase
MTASVSEAPNLWERLEEQRPTVAQLSVWRGSHFVDWTWDDWRNAAVRTAAGLRRRGIEAGSRVACVLTNSIEACSTVLGIWMAGGTIVSMPAMARGMSALTYLSQLRTICRQARPGMVLADAEFVPFLSHGRLGVPLLAFQNLAADGPFEPTFSGPRDEAFVQYSSGSTTDPHGCVLTADAIVHQLLSLERVLEIDPEADVVVSWLPMSHDMGLFGCLLMSYWTGLRLTMSTPKRFLLRPTTWLEDCARTEATMTATPNFALEMVAQAAGRQMPGPFPMRACVIGGERVEARTLVRVNEVFGDDRFPNRCFTPAYGLAEAVLAVTMTPPTQEPGILSVDAGALQAGEIIQTQPSAPGSIRLVSAGPPLPGNRVAVRDSAEIGEIFVRSPSLAVGYIGPADLTQRMLGGELLRTGDLGFLNEGELFLTGRLDDMISVGARNIFARDIEAKLDKVANIRPGCCALVDVARNEQTVLVLLVETVSGRAELRTLAHRLNRIIRETAAAHVSECYFLPPGLLPKTPSGKVQRFRCRQLVFDPPAGTRYVVL